MMMTRRQSGVRARALASQPSPSDDHAASDPVDVVDYEDAGVDIFGELTSGDLTLKKDRQSAEASITVEARSLGLTKASIEEIAEMKYEDLKSRCSTLLDDLGLDIQGENSSYPGGMPQRAVFCTRTLNLRSIEAIGLDMDYTLVDYDVDAWEGRAYEFALRSLARRGVPTQGLEIDKDLVIRGLIIDTRHGNIVKTDRFGFVKRAMHGTTRMSAAEVRTRYGRELVNLKDEGRWVFLNTFFSVSEAVLYAQLVDRLDSGAIERTVCPRAYDALYALVKEAVFDAHIEGTLKQEIMENPSRFVRAPDPELPQTLIDQRQAGKTLMLITNSDFKYTATVMKCALGSEWKTFFDIIIVNARKPDFWNSNAQLYEIVSEDGLMRPVQKLTRQSDRGKVFSGGSAKQVQDALGVPGSSILYVGDHIYTDAAMAKLQFSWRTCLILRELEAEVEALASGRAHRQRLKGLLDKKERIGFCFNRIRLERQRILTRPKEEDRQLAAADVDRVENFNRVLAELLAVMSALDDEIAPAIERDGHHFNKIWGHLCRAGANDRSQLLKQIEKYADLYTSKVSNLGLYSPFMYWRSPPVSMNHDRQKKDETVLKVQRGVRDG